MLNPLKALSLPTMGADNYVVTHCIKEGLQNPVFAEADVHRGVLIDA